MFLPHPKPPPNAPNSKYAPPACSLVIVYICLHIPPYQEYPAQPALHPAPSASQPTRLLKRPYY